MNFSIPSCMLHTLSVPLLPERFHACLQVWPYIWDLENPYMKSTKGQSPGRKEGIEALIQKLWRPFFVEENTLLQLGRQSLDNVFPVTFYVFLSIPISYHIFCLLYYFIIRWDVMQVKNMNAREDKMFA